MVLECLNKVWHQRAVRIVRNKIQKMSRAGKGLNLSDDEVELLGEMKDNPQKDTFWGNQNQAADMIAGDW